VEAEGNDEFFIRIALGCTDYYTQDVLGAKSHLVNVTEGHNNLCINVRPLNYSR